MEPIKSLIGAVLAPFELHPLVAPYLGCSKDEPTRFLHQQELLALLVPRLPIRAFIGDEIGLGKTVSAIAVAKCLWEHGRARRILLILPRVLIYQWRKELERMGISPAIVYGLERESIPDLMRRGFPEGYYLTSMDLIKRENHIRRIENVPWDLIIVDEAHRFGIGTERFENVGKKLLTANPKTNVLLLSATPHRGDPRDYLARLNLIDPYLISKHNLDSRTFYELTHGAVMFRRTKEDVNNVYEGRQVFPPAKFYAYFMEGTDEEKNFAKRTVLFLKSKIAGLSRTPGLTKLLSILIFKRASSSPYALLTTAQRMLARRRSGDVNAAEKLTEAVKPVLGVGYEEWDLEAEPDEVIDDFLEQASSILNDEDVEELESIVQMARDIVDGGGDSKLKALLLLLEAFIDKGLKVVVFTEYKDTLEYVYSYLKRNRPKWRLLRLSSDETGNPEEFKRIRNAFERNPDARILIATDVVAEGVNMQVANVLINYEVPWSIVKLEQRLGRVWRLGQTREVEAYTFFIDNLADKAALNKIYMKLMDLNRAGIRPTPLISGDLLFADASKIPSYPQNIPPDRAGLRKKELKMSEFELIDAFLRSGEQGLEEIVRLFLEAREKLMKELSSKNVLYRLRTKEEVERVFMAFGFQGDTLGPFVGFLEACAPWLGIAVKRDGGRVLVTRGEGMQYEIRFIDDVFKLLSPYQAGPAVLAALGESEERLMIATASVRAEGKLIHAEPVMLSLESGAIYRGAELLRKASELARALIGRVEEPLPDVPLELHASLVDAIKRSLREILSPIEAYRGKLQQVGLREPDSWANLDNVEIKVVPKVLVRVVRGGEVNRQQDVELKKRIELEAMEVAMKYERDHGRIPTDVSASEHYDIKSIDPSTGEVMYIEVKGHQGPVAGAELTEDEAEFASKNGPACWLYIVYDISSGSPKLLSFRDPMRSLAWKVVERVEKRYVWP